METVKTNEKSKILVVKPALGKEEQKKEITKAKNELNEILHPTAESRIKKLENFKILADKHNFLVKANDNLQKFIVSSDGMKEKIILQNSQGFTFEASNSQVVNKVIEVIKNELQAITNDSEKQILEFSI